MDIIENGFACRLKTLRESYDVSMNELTSFLFLKNISSVAAYESGKTYPSYEILLKTALFFGVSVDWLVGLSDIPYTDASIAAGYKAVVNRQLRVDPDNIIGNIITVVTPVMNQSNYINQLRDVHKKRSPKEESIYLEETRIMKSNDIFFRNTTFLNDLEHQQSASKSNAGSLLQKGIDWFNKQAVTTNELKRLEKKQIERYKLFFRFMNGEITEPIFKVE
ncbi:MAG: hypothetical protein SPL36_01620 [Succiniclasticum sp.]|nr:hypothetical protein [Succiniclasticum sp.]